MKNRNILLIVEGDCTEVEVFQKIGELFLDRRTKLSFYPYKSNIYSLYQKIKKYEELASTIDILKEIAPNKILKKMLNINFSEIYLIFDYDPQEPAYSDSKIKEMVELFDNETEFGKLYINYPMMESYRDHNKFGLDEFINRKVEISGLTSSSYKDYIKEFGYKRPLSSMTIRHFKQLTKMNIIKANLMLREEKELPSFENYKSYIKQINILKSQIKNKNEKFEFYVLNTCMFFIIDYFGDRYYREL